MHKKKTQVATIVKKKNQGSGEVKIPSMTKTQLTQVTIIYDVGFGRSLTIRGQGAGLSWERGVPLRNVKSNEWVWETKASFTVAEFKVLINDRIYETGPNHSIKCGSTIKYTPRF